MGYGDALLASGLAEEAFGRDPGRGPVLICDGDGKPRWRLEWEGNPAILPQWKRYPGGPTIRLGKGYLPYHPWDGHWRARDHRGTLYLTKGERKRALHERQVHGRFALIEPPSQDRKNRNRFWHGWPDLATRLQPVFASVGLTLMQLQRNVSTRLPGIPGLVHGNFREACALLQAADFSVLTEGGITIAAGTLRVPAVVLWGGHSSVEAFGYPEHINIVDDDPRTPCHASKTCQHCVEAWARLTVDHVVSVVEAAVRDLKRKAA